jgi:hypothetical protein
MKAFRQSCTAALWLLSGFIFAAASLSHAAPEPSSVKLIRTPNGGIQPQAAVDANGKVHLVYYKGDPRAGDLFYVSQDPKQDGFSAPIPINHQKGSALAMGTIRGAQLAVGKNGRVHVVWNGGDGAKPEGHQGAPLLYARLGDAGRSFEPERDRITFAAGLDGGGSVAADERGNVFVVWHGRAADSADGEEGRAVYVARSKDEGKTFERERAAFPELNTGACGCCGLRAFADNDGALYILFRAASSMTNRDELLVVSHDHGAHFQIANSDKWISSTCPMSSAFLSAGRHDVLAAWETAAQVLYTRVDSKTGRAGESVAPAGKGERKHPVVVQNERGHVLLVWAEGTGWEKGGSLAWQVFDELGQPLGKQGKADGIPVWSFATAFVNPRGEFVVVF